MKLVDEFKAFAMKGNVVDMAVGIIIGAAFGKIVSSLVSDIIMPPLGMLIGGVNFTDLKLDINPGANEVIQPRRKKKKLLLPLLHLRLPQKKRLFLQRYAIC